MRKQQGILIHRDDWEGYDIRFGITDYFGGLKEGQAFDIRAGNHWIPVRLEVSSDGEWYITGLHVGELNGLLVRI